MGSLQGKTEFLPTEQDNEYSRDVSDDIADTKGGALEAEDTSNLKLDKHGLPLLPQPTNRKDDPLVCETHTKLVDRGNLLTKA